MGISYNDFEIAQLKNELDAEIIKLEVKLDDGEDKVSGIRAAADNLFAASVRRKHSIGESFTGYRDLIENGALRGR